MDRVSASRRPRRARAATPRLAAAVLAAVGLLAVTGPAAAQDRRPAYPGPFEVEVERIVDGDTIVVRAHIWPEQVVTTRVRLDGIDTPELRGRCEAERSAGARARDYVQQIVTRSGGALLLRDVQLGKYAGRVLGRLETRQGLDLGRALMANGLGVPYQDRRAQRERLCGDG